MLLRTEKDEGGRKRPTRHPSTSTFTSTARRWIAEMDGRIRAIDGRQLELLLQNRYREIALAYRDILSNAAGK